MTTDTKPQVLAIGTLCFTLPEYRDFASRFEVIPYQLLTREAFIADLKGKYSTISAIWLDHLGLYSIGGALAEVRAAFPASLKVMSLSAIGYSEYHGAELRAERDIILCNNPAPVAIEQVADLATYHVLNAFRYFNLMEHRLRTTQNCFDARIQIDSASWDTSVGTPTLLLAEAALAKYFSYGHAIGGRDVRSLKGKHAFILGMGSIGSELAKRLMTMGMYVHYTKRSGAVGPKEAAEICYFGKPGNNAALTFHSSFEAFAGDCDVVINCMPLTSETKHFLNEKRIKLMKPGSKIVNVGRGLTVDTQALLTHGLKTGHISYFAADVFESEPTVPEELMARYDVALTPHIGSSTVEAIEAAALQCMENIKNVVLYNGPGYTTVN